MRVFVDANTLVSGLLFDGPEAKLLDKTFTGDFELVTSDGVLAEVIDVITRKFPSKIALAKEMLGLAQLELISRSSYEKFVEEQSVRDLEDRHVLAAAI